MAVCHPLAAPRFLTPRVSQIAFLLVIAASLLSSVPTVFEYRTASSGDGIIRSHTDSTNFTNTTEIAFNTNQQNYENTAKPTTQGGRSMSVNINQYLRNSDSQSALNSASNDINGCDSSIGEAGFERTNIGNHPFYTIGYF